ncbi:penicillin-binding transpeptidase domain-containing protein [Aestuariibius sp. 2305UL40-4]|uniref:penicillin-binding transpeptidase domain-containing protein n=1 Tax=Aestuariibius violaceus TaxID=3234132 RepID=UPI00345E2BD7
MRHTTFAAAVLTAVMSTLLPSAGVAFDRVLERDAFEGAVGDRPLSFLASDLADGSRCTLSGSDFETRHAPWSTFKMPNLLIALETGAADGLGAARDWDRERHPARDWWPAGWAKDHTLESAFRVSAVWYFRDLARDIGTEAYRARLVDWGYGNAGVPEGADDFWLANGLEISVVEQVRFLERLLQGELGVSAPSVAALAQASLEWEGDGLSLHGKTGGGTLVPGDFSAGFEGWYVGWVAREAGDPAVFALYTRADSFAEIRVFRKEMAVTLLEACGLLPEGAG